MPGNIQKQETFKSHFFFFGLQVGAVALKRHPSGARVAPRLYIQIFICVCVVETLDWEQDLIP